LAVADIAASGTGTFITKGRVKVPKEAGSSTAIARGARVGYDFANDRCDDAAAVVATGVLGIVTVAAVDADTEVEIELNEDQPPALASVNFTITSTEAALNSNNGQVDFQTGFGAAPAGAVAQVRTVTTGRVKSTFDVTFPTGGDLGKVRVAGVAAGTQLDTGDIVDVIAWRNLGS
jgi:hypothetical protein